MSKTRDTGYLANVIQVHDTGVRIMSGSEMLMAISSSGQVTITGELSGSDAANSLLLSGTGSVGFTTTSSFLAVSSSQQQVSASYIALSGSYNTFSGSASTRTTQIEQVYATTGSNSFRATQSITGSLTVTGQIIAQTLNVQQVTSSIIYSSGSNNFGCDLNSRQTFTGSVLITGSLTIAGASSATSYSGTTIYGSTAVCSPVGKFTSCIDAGSGTFSDNVLISKANLLSSLTIKSSCSTTGLQLYLYGQNATLSNQDNGSLVFQTNGADRLTITSTGAATFACQVCAPSIGLTAGGTINNLANIQYGGYTWAGYNTSNGTITISNTSGCGINFATGEACFAGAINSPGGTISQDLRIYRSAGITTGYINFGSTGTNYFGFDGTKYVANGSISATSFIGGTMSGTTIYGSTAVCSPVGKFTTCLDLGGALTGTSGTFSGILSSSGGDIRSTGTAADSVTAGPFISVRNASNAYQMLMQLNASYGLDIWSYGGAWDKRMTITSTGIACFACQVCAPNAVINCLGVNAIWSSGGGANQPLQVKSGVAGSGIWIESCSSDAGGYINMNGNCLTIGQSYRTSAGFNDILFQTAGNTRMTIRCTGIVDFSCNVCAPKTITNGTVLFRSNIPTQGDFLSYQQNIGGCGLSAQAGGDYVHIKTNITKDDRMVGFNVRGYHYAPEPIDTDIAFYTYSPVGYVYSVSIYEKSYTGWSYCLYYSTDSKVVLVVQGSGTYGGFILTGINTAKYNQMGEMCILGVAHATCWCAQF